MATQTHAGTQSGTPARTQPGTHFAILQLGVSIWNQWRASEPLIVPNLRNADLSGFHLENVNLCRADLRNANLSKAYLYEADFQSADLRNANLTRAGLIGANLHRANLSGAIIKQAYLAQSDLSNANLTDTHLQKTDLQAALLTQAIFTRAQIAEADFTASLDLTRSQVACAQAVHLACFDPALSAQLSLSDSGFLDTSRPIEVFKPEPVPMQPLRHRLTRRFSNRFNGRFNSRLNASRNAAVANVGLS
jgi:hypothetical protein